MSGESISDLDLPVSKRVSGIVALAPEFLNESEEKTCTRCGLCVEACPEELNPEMLIRAIRHEEGSLAREFQLSACTECGNCTFVCPSKIPMAEILRGGKSSFLNEKRPAPIRSAQEPVYAAVS